MAAFLNHLASLNELQQQEALFQMVQAAHAQSDVILPFPQLQTFIFEEPAFCAVNQECLRYFCSHCFTFGANLPKKRCGGCKVVHYCSVKCHTADWKAFHNVECKLLQKSGVDVNVKMCTETRFLMRALTFLRSPGKRLSFFGKKGYGFENLASKSKQRKGDKAEVAEFERVKCALDVLGCESDFANMDLWDIFCKLRSNACPIWVPDPFFMGVRRIGLGLYINFCRFKHSPTPNLSTHFEFGRLNPPKLVGCGDPNNLAQPKGLGIVNGAKNMSQGEFNNLTIDFCANSSFFFDFGTALPAFAEKDALMQKQFFMNFWLSKTSPYMFHHTGKGSKAVAKWRDALLKDSTRLACPVCEGSQWETDESESDGSSSGSECYHDSPVYDPSDSLLPLPVICLKSAFKCLACGETFEGTSDTEIEGRPAKDWFSEYRNVVDRMLSTEQRMCDWDVELVREFQEDHGDSDWNVYAARLSENRSLVPALLAFIAMAQDRARSNGDKTFAVYLESVVDGFPPELASQLEVYRKMAPEKLNDRLIDFFLDMEEFLLDRYKTYLRDSLPLASLYFLMGMLKYVNEKKDEAYGVDFLGRFKSILKGRFGAQSKIFKDSIDLFLDKNPCVLRVKTA